MVARQFNAPLVGMRFRPPAEDVVNSLPGGTKLRVEFQEDNPYDADALAVFLDGFEEGGANEMCFNRLKTFFESEGEADKLQLLCSPLMLGFVANSEKTGGKFASTIKAYMQMDGRHTVDAALGFDAQARPLLIFEWNPDEAVPQEHKVVTTSPLEAATQQQQQKQPRDTKRDLDDEIPF